MSNPSFFLRPLTCLLLVVLACTIASSAHAQWQPDGVALSTAANDQYYPTIVSDGAGGAIVTWQDPRSGTNYDIYAQRVNAAGVPQWTANGVALCTAASDQYYPTIVSDGAGGAIVSWQDLRSGTNYDIYAQRVNALGVPQWTADGVALCTAGQSQELPTSVSDGAGGAIVTWQDHRSGTNDEIYARRVNAAGVPQWTANGVALCTATNGGGQPTIVSDGAGGAIVTWNDSRSGTNVDIYAQRVNASGAPQWTANGVALCTDTNDQGSSMIVSDGAGGAIVTWQDHRSGSGSFDIDIYARRVSASGVPQWTADGVALCIAANDQLSPTIVSDGAGGAIVTWYDRRSVENYDIYAQRVNASGTPQWTANGVAVCTAANDQVYPTIVSDGAGGAIVTWQDHRSGTSYDVYASIANGNTSAGTNVPVTPVDATTGTTPVVVTFDNVGDGSTSLATGTSGPALPGSFASGDGLYYNLSTTSTFSGNVEVCITYNPAALTIPESAVRLIHYDATLVPPDWVDITTLLNTGLNQVCGVTASLSPFVIGAQSVTTVGDGVVPARAVLHQNSPNPFNPTTAIAFEVRNSGAQVRIHVYDMAGRPVRTLVDRPFAAGMNHVSWDGRGDHGERVASGVYFYRMDSGSFREMKKMVLLR